MQYGLNMPAFGDFADPRALAALALQAEQAGWQAFFIWDHMFFDPSFHPMVDPWVGLAAVAAATSTIRIGTMITPLSRRRPWKVARETVSLDLLSNGRLTLGVGLGDPVQWDFGFFREEQNMRIRAQRLDESLDILTGLWTGEKFSYHGQQFQLDEVIFKPTPVQNPRIPIWVGGNLNKKRPMERAARWDGYVPLKWGSTITPDEWRTSIEYIQQHRTVTTPIDFVHSGVSVRDKDPETRLMLEALDEAGVTWWMESVDPWGSGISWETAWSDAHTKLMVDRVLQGPPNLL